ncbi:glucose 1-dehydrogenase [Rubrobacter marinus]|uniref:Glucose 1-dehydrogenase n=1 Tax=Rubrobacter marinus TaxID=2653852 RepID=A0A6G8Q367_9ACTN|nr:3-oxoacyl-ACP reductase family protein [Rubrobacter marinus]QIN80888.1 glucose 1-dehydrogenase [Rubrobacter marinus]
MFSGEVAWVTGSSKGIGRAVAIGLAEHGCDVAVHYNRGESEAREVVERIEATGRAAIAVRGDVSDSGDVGRMVGEIEERFGRLDVLVNNAGSFVERRSFEQMTEDLWDRVMAVNLKSVYLCSQAVLPMMKRQGAGKIINISSMAARTGGSSSSIAYSAAKGGVSTLTRGMAKDLGPKGIRVNAVAPGRIDTPLHEEFTPAERREEAAQGIPLKREGTPEEIVGAVLFLASPHASYVLGEVIEVNGGILMD